MIQGRGALADASIGSENEAVGLGGIADGCRHPRRNIGGEAVALRQSLERFEGGISLMGFEDLQLMIVGTTVTRQPSEIDLEAIIGAELIPTDLEKSGNQLVVRLVDVEPQDDLESPLDLRQRLHIRPDPVEAGPSIGENPPCVVVLLWSIERDLVTSHSQLEQSSKE